MKFCFDWCLTARQHMKINLSNGARAKPTRAVKDGQREMNINTNIVVFNNSIDSNYAAVGPMSFC